MLIRLCRAIGVLLTIAPLAASAQYDRPRLLWEFYFGAGAKAGLIQQPRMRYHPWGEVNVGASIGLTGANEHSLTARLHVQNSRDDIVIRVAPGERYGIESVSLLVNPEVALPLMNRYGESKLDLLAGIGADILLDHWMSVRNVAGYYAGTALESLEDSVYQLRNKLMPYATAGIAIRFHPRACLVLRIRQDLRNTFEKGSKITLYASSGEQTVNLSTQATRLLIGFQFRLGKMPESY